MNVPVTPLVHLRTVHHVFHARVIAARLGADGIVTQLRGAVDGPYPVGDVSVWVAEADLECAGELLLADEVEAALDPVEPVPARRPLFLGLTGMQLLAAVGIVVILWSAVLARVLG